MRTETLTLDLHGLGLENVQIVKSNSKIRTNQSQVQTLTLDPFGLGEEIKKYERSPNPRSTNDEAGPPHWFYLARAPTLPPCAVQRAPPPSRSTAVRSPSGEHAPRRRGRRRRRRAPQDRCVEVFHLPLARCEGRREVLGLEGVRRRGNGRRPRPCAGGALPHRRRQGRRTRERQPRRPPSGVCERRERAEWEPRVSQVPAAFYTGRIRRDASGPLICRSTAAAG
jgi:hypothetical protein